MKFVSKWIELEKKSFSVKLLRSRKINMVCICLYVNISHQINANHRPREEYGVWGGEMGLRKGIQWETARIGRHLRDSMRTQFSVFLKYMKAILKKFPNDEGKGVPPSHVLTPNEASSSGIVLHLIQLLYKSTRRTPNNPLCCQAYRLLYKLTASPHCWRQYLHNSLNKEKLSRCPHRAFTFSF